jgi:hypothetical protein
MNRTTLYAAALVTGALGLGAFAEPAEAQGFTLRAGADVRPLLYFGNASGTIADGGFLALHVAPGFKIAEVLTLELDVIPLIPIAGDPKPEFEFLVAPGVWVDLMVVYVRGSLPISFTPEVNFWLEAGAGISFLGKGYVGILIDYYNRSEIISIGPEIGFKF